MIQQALPTPFNTIEYTRSGTILGRQIHIGNKPLLAVNDRIHKAKQTWVILRNKLFLNEGIKPRIRIQLWNALVRSTQTYALQTKNIEHDQSRRKMEGFSYKCIRQIRNKHRYKEDKRLSRDSIYKKYTQPTITSWVRKLATTHYLRQTTNSWKIHTHEHANIQNTGIAD